MSQQNVSTVVGGPLSIHKLILNFDMLVDIGPLPYIGIYDAFRYHAYTTESFKLILCYFNEPPNIWNTPGDSDDKFEINIGAGAQTFVHEFNQFSLADNIPECGTFVHRKWN